MSEHKLFIGMSGYSYGHWKEIFYPKGLAQAKWLPFYAERYNTVEVNATFYRFFERSVYERWHELTPPEFKFALKGPNAITRYKRLQDVEAELERFFSAAAGLGEKLAVVLWQMPPSFKNDAETLAVLEAFLRSLPAGARQAVEFRHESWRTEAVYALLNRLKVGWVSAQSKRFMSEPEVTGGLGYYRFHGPGALYSSSYSDEQLEEWAQIIRKTLKSGNAYCYFNNDVNGYALENGNRLREILRH